MIENRSILITGINGNVGLACMKEAACRGWMVEGAAREYKRDLTDWGETSKWIAETDGFDLVVMSHGVQKTATMRDVNEELWKNIIGNNLDASASLTHALLKYDKVRSGGLIVYFSSIQATQPRKGRAPYAAAKAGIEGLTRAVSVELIDRNARAIALRIGQMLYSMKGIMFTQDQMREIENKIPLPLVAPEDIAELVFDLHKQKSLTGDVIEITSGHTYKIWN